ncbi:MAG: lipopolysaccharide heptosyltransferase II [Deltaproteobacteria bacterium]|nr:lipopolysaccharide heptosyltransferase II [Deltaproteobacteria bacterium]
MKFLIIRLGSMGDVVLTTPVIKVLKDRYPDAELDFLVKKEYSNLLAANPNIRKIIPFNSKGEHRGVRGLLNAASELREERYTHVIDLHGNLRSRMISALLRGSKTLRYDKQALKRRMLLLGLKVHTIHTVDAYLEALEPLFVGAGLKPAPTPILYLSKADKAKAEVFLVENDLSNASVIIGLAPGAKWRTKMWPEENFIEVGRRLVKELGAKILVFGGPDEAELCIKVAEGIGKGTCVAGKVGLRDAAALISRCKAFVSNDSGPMHIATAVGTPVVAIFGPTIRGFGFSPLGKSAIVEKEMKCRPCSLHGGDKCPNGHFECMKGIPVDEVFERVRELLN